MNLRFGREARLFLTTEHTESTETSLMNYMLRDLCGERSVQ